MTRTWLSAAVLSLTLAGCAGLPASAPTSKQVVGSLRGQDVTVIDIVPGTASGLAAAVAPLPAWAIGDAAPGDGRIAVGDVLQVAVFEAGYSLFTAPGERSLEGAAPRQFPGLQVADDGTIRFPFAGSVVAAGRSPTQVAAAIEGRLKGKSQAAQVVVTAEPGPRRSVTVSGEVKKPGRIGLTSAGERLLDAIALASGPEPRKADTLVRLTRGGVSAIARLDAIGADADQNVVLAPGDRIELIRAVRTLTALGAANRVNEIAFDSAELTLSEALARAGGADDEKADATGVFIFRYELRESGGQAQAVPVIYRLNLLEPQSYFAAQRFQMREKDVMLVANARSNQLRKFVTMLNSLTAPILTADLLTR